MTLDEFWDHIRATRRRDPEAHGDRLVKRLAKLSPEEIIDFDHWWKVSHRKAYRRALWDAAYVINGGCSDDGFHYFRDWLILQGRDVFEAAITDPDTLAAVVKPDEEYEYEGHPALDAWFGATGTGDDQAGYLPWDAAYKARYPGTPPKAALIEDLTAEEELAVPELRFTRLAKLYLDRD